MTASIPGIEASRRQASRPAGKQASRPAGGRHRGQQAAGIEASRQQASRPAGKQTSRPAGGRHQGALDKKRKQQETEKVGPRPDTASAAKLAEPSPSSWGHEQKESKRETLPPTGGRSNQRARVS